MKIVRQMALAAGLLGLIALSWLAPLDAPAMQHVDAGLKRALVSFATARALNGVISVLQGTQIDVQPGGLGATFAPGQIVAPINELVKHFSDLMLAASVAFGIQKVLISISGYWALSTAMTAMAVVWFAQYCRPAPAPIWVSKVLVLLLMLRFAVPVVTLGTDFVSQEFMAADYATSQQAIDAASGQVAQIIPSNKPAASDGGKWWGKLSGALPTVPDFDAMNHAVERATEHMVKLMAIFLLQTLVLPALLLWVLYAAAKAIFDLPRAVRDRT